MSNSKKMKRAEKYDCDGNCYPDFGLSCPNVMECPETRSKELIGLAIAFVLFGLCIITIIVGIFIMICGGIK